MRVLTKRSGFLIAWLLACTAAHGQSSSAIVVRKVDELRNTPMQTASVVVQRIDLAVGSESEEISLADDTVYHVLDGEAVLRTADKENAVSRGSVVCVPAGLPRRFVEVGADLSVLAIVALRPRTTGGMATGPTPVEQTAYPEGSQRGNARIFYWYGPNSAGQLSIDHGQPLWKPAYGAFLTKPSGRRWRLGENFWTSLDTNMELQIGGVTVPIGQHYLVLQHTADAGIELVALDPHDVRARRLDSYQAPTTSGGIAIPMTASKSAVVEPRLSFSLAVDPQQNAKATLTIRFGPHVLEAPIVMHPRSR